MIGKLIEVSMIGMVGVGIVAETIPLTDWLTRFGALGLVGFMIVQNYRQSRALGAVIGKKDDRIRELTIRLEELVQDNTAANVRLAEAIEHRLV